MTLPRPLKVAAATVLVVAVALLLYAIWQALDLTWQAAVQTLLVGGFAGWLWVLTMRQQLVLDRTDQAVDMADRLYEHLWRSYEALEQPQQRHREPEQPSTEPIPAQPDTEPVSAVIDDWARQVAEHKRQLDADEAEFWRQHPTPTQRGTK